MKRDGFLLHLLFGIVLGLTFATVSWACSTLTDPPANWPKSTGPDPTAYPLPSDNVNVFAGDARKRTDGGR